MQKTLRRALGKDWALGYALVAPSLILLVVFSFYPIISAIVNSFFDWHLANHNVRTFIGLENYRQLFSGSLFKKVFLNTLHFTIGTVPTGIVLALMIALPLSGKLHFLSFYRSAYFLPVVTPVVAVSLGWMMLYDVNYGMINFLLEAIGMEPQAWLTMPATAMNAVIIMSVWKGLGTNIVLYISALNAIPQQLYEAARIDGANPWKLFCRITWPLVLPTTSFVLVISTIGSFQAFGQIHIMTKGGPLNATATIVYDLYLNAFSYMKMGYASAEGVLLFICLLIFTMLQRVLAQHKERELM